MTVRAGRLGFAFALLMACLGGQTAHAQTGSTGYWTPGWLGFGGNLEAGQGSNTEGSNTDGNVSGFDTRSVGGVLSTRYNFPNGWFVGNERRGMGLSMNGIDQASAFGSLYSESVQFGYNFNNSPVTVYAGFNTLKYNPGFGSALAPFDTTPVAAGYGMRAGIEFKPTSNFSLSLDAGVVQRSGRIDSDSTSSSQFGASQYDLVRSRR
jgi:hypothetical protein